MSRRRPLRVEARDVLSSPCRSKLVSARERNLA
jgi:hypothetical protein